MHGGVRGEATVAGGVPVMKVGESGWRYLDASIQSPTGASSRRVDLIITFCLCASGIPAGRRVEGEKICICFEHTCVSVGVEQAHASQRRLWYA